MFLTKEKNAAERLTDALLRNEAAIKLLNNSEFEVPEIQMIEGLAFRGKADIIQGNTIIDREFIVKGKINDFNFWKNLIRNSLKIYLNLFYKSNFKK